MFTGFQFLHHSSAVYALTSLLYPVALIPTKRTKNLKVICLGLPRSGTESLSLALLRLGYSDVSHGIVHFWLNNANTGKLWYELGVLRAQNRLPDPQTLRTQHFDRTLGDCEATTDIPSVWFAAELMAAYPEAQVVLNRRRDTKAWKESFRQAIMPLMVSRAYWWGSWFQSELFWGMGISYFLHGTELLKGDFERYADSAYDGHYARVEALLEKEKRPYLKWSVEDGWSPLCEFLNRPIPDEAFPDGNRAAEFMPKLRQVDGARFAAAMRNAGLFLAGLVAVSSGVWYVLWKQNS